MSSVSVVMCRVVEAICYGGMTRTICYCSEFQQHDLLNEIGHQVYPFGLQPYVPI